MHRLLHELWSLRRLGYGSGLPSEADFKFIELAELFSSSTARARESLRQAVPDDVRQLLLGFSDRLAILAERQGEPHYLFLALLAHSIEDFAYDERENVFRLALVNHVAGKLGLDSRELFSRAAELSSRRGATALLDFEQRPPSLKSLDVMRIAEVSTEDGIDYRYVD